MVGAVAGFALATVVSSVSFRPGPAFHAPGPSSSVQFLARPWVQAPLAGLVVVAWYSPSYESEDEEDEEEGRQRLGEEGPRVCWLPQFPTR